MKTGRKAVGRLRSSLILLLLTVSACATWTPSEVSPRELIEQEEPRLIRVRTADGESRLAHHPRIEADAVVVDGECRRSPNPRGGYVCPTETVAALDDVRNVDVRRLAWGRSLLLAVGVSLLGFGYAFSTAW